MRCIVIFIKLVAALYHFEEWRSVLYRGANVLLVCFSVNCSETFHNVRSKWIPEVRYLDYVWFLGPTLAGNLYTLPEITD